MEEVEQQKAEDVRRIRLVLGLDENYIEECSTPVPTGNADKDLASLLTTIAFIGLKKAIDEGKKELVIKNTSLDLKELDLLTSGLRGIAVLAMKEDNVSR